MARHAVVWEAVRSRTAMTRTLFLLLVGVLTITTQHQVLAQKQRQPGGGLALVKCYCLANEIRTDNATCEEQPGGTKVIVETGQMSSSALNVEVRLLDCPESHTEISLMQGDVHLRHRGDWVVLRGPWRGLRINKYCLTHTNSEAGFPTWMIRACIPPPTVPMCCPGGQTMKGDKCVNATSIPEGAFDPPLLPGPGEPPRSWPGKTEELNPLQIPCRAGGTVRQALLGRQAERKASVIALPTGLVLVTKRGSALTEYTFAPDFCVDRAVIHQNGGANASYFAFYCDQVEASDLRCNDTNVCVRKCCGEGQAMHAHISTCVPTTQSFIAPFEAVHPKEVHVLVGLPKCAPIGLVMLQQGLDERGRFISRGRQYNSSEYCIENFIRGNTSAIEVLICMTETKQTGWASVRLYITPVFLAVSAACAVVLLILMWLLPELRRDGGQAQASHAVAILLATLTLLILQIPSNFSKPACIFMAILLHFSFMSMFTWVAVMSLVLWMRVRTIAGSGGGPPINQTLIQQCTGWGIPLIVIFLNVTIHFTVPTDQTGVIHPRIAEGRCWYAGTLEVVLYFYLPILVLVITSAIVTGLSLWHYCTMSRESIDMNGLGDQDANANGTTPDVTMPNAFNPREPDNKEKQHSFNFTHEIRQHSILVGFAIFFWITEGLSMEIKPVDIWILADIINSLYGLVALLVFILNPNKRRHLKLQDLKNSFIIRIKNIAKFRPLCMKSP